MLDAVFGSPVKKYLLRLQERKLGEVSMHRIRLQEAEEDEGLFLYLWESLFNWFFVARDVDNNPYWRFQTQIPKWRQRRIFRFYAGCLKRHLYVHGTDGVYIAKNPSFSAKTAPLLDHFPDARIIYLVRHPYDASVSVMGWFSFAWNYFAATPERLPFRDTVLELTREWYLTPLQRLQELPANQFAILKYEDLVEDPEESVPRLLDQLQLPFPSDFRDSLSRLPRRDPNDRSHTLSLSDIGLTTESAARFYREVLDRYNYD